jgi:hypothetical protein
LARSIVERVDRSSDPAPIFDVRICMKDLPQVHDDVPSRQITVLSKYLAGLPRSLCAVNCSSKHFKGIFPLGFASAWFLIDRFENRDSLDNETLPHGPAVVLRVLG